MIIVRHPIQRVMVDSGSLIDILFYDVFAIMNISPDLLKLIFTPLIGFIEDFVGVEGEITFSVTTKMLPQQSPIMETFTIIRLPSVHNVILGHFELNLLYATILTKQVLIQFPTPYGITEMWGS